MSDFGFSSLNKNLNDNFNNSFNIKTFIKADTLIVPARVKSILLDESYYRFEELGGWNSLGVIEYELVNTPDNINTFPIAYPLTSNNKFYPLINEIVYIISLPDDKIDSTNVSKKSYYINIVSLWNHPHHNAYPSIANEPNPPQQKDYIQTQVGSTRVVTDETKQIFLGKTFKERANIHPLLPFEGDIIYEGRWGNSIRLGSTVKSNPNNWSSTGDNGDPITIIRNGQGAQTDQGWIPTVENINNDDTSIYLTSTQNIPVNPASADYTSYQNNPPTSPSKYAGSQIILDSGRLVFNAYSDHILLTSSKTINLNSLISVNIDTKKFIVQSNNIYLGREDLATQHLMLGDNTVEFLKVLIGSLKSLITYLKVMTSDPVTDGQPATFSLLKPKAAALESTLESLENQLKNDVLISQRNFTL